MSNFLTRRNETGAVNLGLAGKVAGAIFVLALGGAAEHFVVEPQIQGNISQRVTALSKSIVSACHDQAAKQEDTKYPVVTPNNPHTAIDETYQGALNRQNLGPAYLADQEASCVQTHTAELTHPAGIATTTTTVTG